MGVWDRDGIGPDGKAVREKSEKDTTATRTRLGGLNFACFLANVDAPPEKWREFVQSVNVSGGRREWWTANPR